MLASLQSYRQRSGRRVINAYGPTETTVNCSFALLEDRVVIGRPMAGSLLHVLGEGEELLPAGVVGELYVGGAALSRGYLGRADLTNASFCRHPTLGRLYRTGGIRR
jgi:non-ribosomal peptide synthetase component F